MSTPTVAPRPSSKVTPPARLDISERPAWSINGWIAILVLIADVVAITQLAPLAAAIDRGDLRPLEVILPLLALVLAAIAISSGLGILAPGQTQVVQFFGRYVGTVRRTGLFMTLPFTVRHGVSVRVRNFETNELKVNDADGNPVNIAAIIVWQVEDTAKSVFAVESYDQFIAVQAESALRHIATSHPYDNAAPGEETLRGSTELVADELAEEVSARIAVAGLRVVEARISSLAYAPEIAGAMLQRQQATAVLAARSKIVEGAVTMVQSALERLEGESIVTLDDERKAAMVTNLLVVLCGESRATPVVNTGTIYP